MLLDLTAVLGTPVGQDPQHRQLVRGVEGQHSVIEQIRRCDGGLGGVELAVRRFGVGIDIGLLIHPAHALEGADIEGVLRAEIARVGRLNLATGLIIELLALQRLNLGLGEDDAFLGHFGLQGLEALLEVGQVIAQPDAPHPTGGDENALLAQLVGDPDLTVGRLIRGVLDYGGFHMGLYTVLGIGNSAVLLE